MQYFKLKEERVHGSKEFPSEYYFVDASHPRYLMQLHWHKEFEIIHVLEGCFHVWLDNKCYKLKEGESLFVGCGVTHRGEPDECTYECLVFDMNMLRKKGIDKLTEYILPFINQTVAISPKVKKEDKELTEGICSLMKEMKERKERFELRFYSYLYAMINTLYSQNRLSFINRDKKDDEQIQTITNLLSWIGDHYTEQLTLEDLSKVSGLNTNYLCRFFKKFTGETPMEYITILRIDTACNLMLQEKMNVAEAAYYCGFNDPSYFTRVFKKRKGMSPKKYIKCSSMI